MNPIIATTIADSVVAQRRQDLLGSAAHSRQARRARAARSAARSRRAPAVPPAPAPSTHVRPLYAFQTWLAAGRL